MARYLSDLPRPEPSPMLANRLADTRDGDVVELCPALPAIASGITERIAQAGGAALVIDYGGWGSLGDTFQAMRAHGYADPLAEPGLADLTAHVDFRALADAFAAGGVVGHRYDRSRRLPRTSRHHCPRAGPCPVARPVPRATPISPRIAA